MAYNSRDNSRRRAVSSHGSGVGHWIPLALTVTVATIGLAAWIWNERKNEEKSGKNDGPPPAGYNGGGGNEGSYGPGAQGPYNPTSQGPYPPGPPGQYPPGSQGNYPPGPQGNYPQGPSGPPGSYPPTDQSPYPPGNQVPYPPGSQPPYASGNQAPLPDNASVVQRVAGALRRTPSPQQILDGASRRVAAGVAAAGAMVGGALSSIREEDKKDFEDHSRWSEEAAAQYGGPSSSSQPKGSSSQKSGDRRRTVAIVISAETTEHGSADEDASYHQEQASILSHLPEHIDADSRVFIMIYDPSLTAHPLATTTASQAPLPPSLTSSYSNIAPEDAHSPPTATSALASPPAASSVAATATRSAKFDALYAEALALVDTPAMVMPFTTSTGYVALLKHTAPEIVYVQAPLAGVAGEAVKHVAGWVGQVVLVVGDESGHGGLVDSEDEHGAQGPDGAQKWWMDDPKIGLGKGIEVVEGLRVGEDWRRRVKGHD